MRATIIKLFILLITIDCVFSFEPLSKEEHIEKFKKIAHESDPLSNNLTECARQVKASIQDIEHFLKRIPQKNFQGKCLVACILKRYNIIVKNKISKENLMDINKEVYGSDNDVLDRLRRAIDECDSAVGDIFEICEYASVFNDCMHMKMEHTLDKVMMERRMEALGQMSKDPDQWTEDEDEMLKMAKDEL